VHHQVPLQVPLQVLPHLLVQHQLSVLRT
jgi:hypothetical protein